MIFETHLDDFEKYRDLLLEDRPDQSSDTATHGGYQKFLHVQEGVRYTMVVQNIMNKLFEENDISLKVTKCINKWIVNYQPGGWQALHAHARQGESVFSTVLYFDESGDDPFDGAFVVVKDNQLFAYKPTPGKLMIVDGKLLHCAYPTSTKRSVIVVDYEVEGK